MSPPEPKGIPGVIELGGLRFPDRPLIREQHRAKLRDGSYEHGERAILGSCIEPGDRVLELGAGIGVISTEAARDHGAEQVLSFEANPRLIPIIRKVHDLNGVAGLCRAENAVLAPEPKKEEVPFYVRGDFLASSTMLPRWAAEQEGAATKGIKKVMVPQRSFDEVCGGFRPDVLICDIEGSEADLLPFVDLSGLRCVMLELHPRAIKLRGVDRIFAAFHLAGLAYTAGLSQRKIVVFKRFRPGLF